MLNGLVLIGGRSRRMGEDKSILVYHNKPQREYLTDLLRHYCDTVYWSVNAKQAGELPNTEQPLIVDAFDELMGPLNGIMSAMQTVPNAAWLVVACDMPLLSNRTLDRLVAARNPAKRATAFYDSDGRFPEPLLCIWEPTMKTALQKSLADGYYSPRQMLMVNDVELLHPPDIRELLNINDPETKAAFINDIGH
ncbi:NTP transferase domain-containing protein [Spirosoma sp. SC4-14]|uniref:NTP transferase domain-containing protein n=1 Tax=Spirosoma sp. SC4-14 TaxID=3128900 RepID=UPI0030D5288F